MISKVTLESGPLTLVLLPELGGSIGRFDWQGGNEVRPILRGADDPSSPLDAACFPLVPFSNRIRGGRFDFGGRQVRLEPNMAGDPSPLHGQGWLAPWQVVSASAGEAELRYRHEAGEWPWAYEARQRFRLSDGALMMELACTNLGEEDMPCGLGFHPYFPCGPGTRLETRVDHVWTIDDKVLPVERVPATGRYSLNAGPICGRNLDNGYGGWSGRARIEEPGAPFAVLLASETRFFQLYSPATGCLFVAEPVTHANAVLNEPEKDWDQLGLDILSPGETKMLPVTLTIQYFVSNKK